MDILLNTSSLLTKRVNSAMVENRAYYSDNHWQDGKGLTVRKPTGDNAADILLEMQAGFAFQNVIAEVVDRRRDGILGREPNYRAVRRDGAETNETELATIEEMLAAVVNWWNTRGLLGILKECLVDASINGRGIVRPFTPSAMRDDNGNILQQNSFVEALDLLHFETVSPDMAGVFLEQRTLKPFSIYKYTISGETFVDFSTVDADGITHFATFTLNEVEDFLRSEFSTSLARYLVERTGVRRTGGNSMNLGGKLHLFEMNLRKTFITESIKSLQKQLNLSLTMQGRNSYTAGVRERHFLNADDPATLTLGAGVSTFVQGNIIKNERGEIVGQSNASLVVIDPVAPTNFIEAENSLYAQILAAAEQRHVLMSDQATASGVSRAEARDEFRNSLRNVKQAVDELGRYVIEFAMMFAAAATNQTAVYENYRIDFDSIISAGVPTPEEKADNRNAYEAGEISLDTLMARNGTEDPDSELSKIKQEDGYELNYLIETCEKAKVVVPLKMIISLLPFDEMKRSEILAFVEDAPPVNEIIVTE